MSDHRWQRVEDIFHRAVELAPEARPAFLDEACGTDQSLRREVESLLAHESDNGTTFAGLAQDDAPQTIAHYRISGKLGQGGMGAVYRATDTKLGREVAIKVLPRSFADDAERMARFNREAKVLASLNHPNIAQIYGIEVRALVMELVPGATLQRPLPIETALNYAKQIAEALEAAHEKGIIHRDLKPANILVTPEGVVKLLDFGLAAVAHVAGDPLSSPTITMQTAQSGIIMGTAAYMSPEQAAGKPVDRRADVWSFGVVLWELLTGRLLFEGDTISLTLASVLRGPIDFDKLPRDTPAEILRLLRRCLDRDVKNRLRDIGEARIAIESALAGETPHIESAPARTNRLWLAWSVAGVALAGLAVVAIVHFREKPPAPAASVRFQLPVPEGGNIGTLLNLSPDGRKLAFIANRRLWVHSFGSEDSRNLTDARGTPFWSPDSRFIAYAIDGKIKRIEATGGPEQTVTDYSGGYGGGIWSREDLIVFSNGDGGGLFQVPAAGGAAVRIAEIDVGRHEIQTLFPCFLPDGRHFLYTRRTRDESKSAIYLGLVDVSPEQQSLKPLANSFWAPVYAPSPDAGIGYLVFMRGETLMAQPFDHRRLGLAGLAVPVAEQMGDGRGFSVSANVLVYEPNNANNVQLTWYDRDGKVLGTTGDRGNYRVVRFSPDGARVAVSPGNLGQALSIELLDLPSGSSRRFAFGSASNSYPVWSPDGSRIVFSSDPGGTFDLYQEPVNRAKDAELLLKTGEDKFGASWSPDGRLLFYTELNPKTKSDIWMLPLDGNRKPLPFLVTQFNEENGRFSPDGRLVAYDSDETGSFEIYVRSFSMNTARTAIDTGGKWQVSKGCARTPYWRRDGRELYYMTCDGYIMAVEIPAGAEFKPGTPQRLGIPQTGGAYGASLDGKRFLVPATDARPQPYTVVLNWQADLKK